MDNIQLLMATAAILLLIGLFGKRKWNRHKHNVTKSKQLLKKLRGFHEPGKDAKIIRYLKKIDAYVFEELVLTALEENGVTIIRGKRYSGDGGIDGKFKHNKRTYIIQAKRYADHVSKAHVIEFGRLASKYGGALFVHTGKTRRSIFKACPANVRIVSGSLLVDLLLARKSIVYFINE